MLYIRLNSGGQTRSRRYHINVSRQNSQLVKATQTVWFEAQYRPMDEIRWLSLYLIRIDNTAEFSWSEVPGGSLKDKPIYRTWQLTGMSYTIADVEQPAGRQLAKSKIRLAFAQFLLPRQALVSEGFPAL